MGVLECTQKGLPAVAPVGQVWLDVFVGWEGKQRKRKECKKRDKKISVVEGTVREREQALPLRAILDLKAFLATFSPVSCSSVSGESTLKKILIYQ